MKQLKITFWHGGSNTYNLDEIDKIERTPDHFIIWEDRESANAVVFYSDGIESIEIRRVHK